MGLMERITSVMNIDEDLFAGIEGMACNQDDIIVWRKDEE